MSELTELRKDGEPLQNNVSVALNGALLKLSNDFVSKWMHLRFLPLQPILSESKHLFWQKQKFCLNANEFPLVFTLFWEHVVIAWSVNITWDSVLSLTLTSVWANDKDRKFIMHP